MADVRSTLRLWSATAASNLPAGTTTIGTSLDDNLTEIQAVMRKYLASPGSNMASASTVDLSTADGFYIQITGTTTITAFGTESAGIQYLLRFAGALTLTHNATSMILPGGASITTAAGDMALMISEGSGNWRCVSYQRASGTQPVAILPVAQGGTGLAALGPTFSAYLAVSGGSMTTATFTKILFDTELWDTNANYASSTFTPTVAGYYQVNAALQISAASPGFLVIYKNGTAYKRGAWNAAASSQSDFHVSGLVSCAASDTIEIYGYQDSGVSRTPQGGVSLTWFDAHFVRGL